MGQVKDEKLSTTYKRATRDSLLTLEKSKSEAATASGQIFKTFITNHKHTYR